MCLCLGRVLLGSGCSVRVKWKFEKPRLDSFHRHLRFKGRNGKGLTVTSRHLAEGVQWSFAEAAMVIGD